MSGEVPENLRPIADFFGLLGTAAVAKDFHVVRAIRALASLDAAPFILVFGGGTALAHAHKLVRRMAREPQWPAERIAWPRHGGAASRRLRL